MKAILTAYAQVGFSRRLLTGALFAAATFVVPQHGVAGLVGLLAADGWARLLGRPRAHIDEGFYGFNGLLVGLAMGLYFRLSVPLLLLLALVSLLVVVVAAAARNLAERYLGIPVLGLPFMIVTWVALLATARFSGLEFTVEPILAGELGAGLLPPMLELYLESLGAVFFQLNVVSGVLVLLGLLWSSRWAVVLSVIGFVAGWAVHTALGGSAADLGQHFIALNFLLIGIAVGGVYVVLSPASMALAAAAGAMTAITGAALLNLLAAVELPALAMPFILTTQLLLFALALRAGARGPRLVVGEVGTPEENLRRVVHRARRFPDPATPLLHPPVLGRWQITQGPDGEHTHRGLWRHAWDFEVVDEDGERHRNGGERVQDWYAWNAPVVAAADGKVVRVVDHLQDNVVGQVDTTHNWGNLVIVWHHGDVFSASCHLARGSVAVREGEAVVRGQVIGRVGNSGRSPVPHLHFQVQASAEIGAPTRHAELLHYVRTEQGAATADSAAVYTTHGSPPTGAVIEPLNVDDGVRRALAIAPGRELKWRWQRPDRGPEEREETWQASIDPLGRRALITDGGRAPFFADTHYFTVLDYEGRPDTLLSMFAIAAARAPFCARRGLRWSDSPAATSQLSAAARLRVELTLPFSETGLVHTRSEVARQAGEVLLTCRVEPPAGVAAGADLPDRFELRWAENSGPVAITGWRGQTCTLRAEVMP